MFYCCTWQFNLNHCVLYFIRSWCLSWACLPQLPVILKPPTRCPESFQLIPHSPSSPPTPLPASSSTQQLFKPACPTCSPSDGALSSMVKTFVSCCPPCCLFCTCLTRKYSSKVQQCSTSLIVLSYSQAPSFISFHFSFSVAKYLSLGVRQRLVVLCIWMHWFKMFDNKYII